MTFTAHSHKAEQVDETGKQKIVSNAASLCDAYFTRPKPIKTLNKSGSTIMKQRAAGVPHTIFRPSAVYFTVTTQNLYAMGLQYSDASSLSD